VYEHRAEPILPRRRFLARFARHVALASAVIAVSIGIGVLGFHAWGGQPWLDAFVNTAMLLGGMGEVGEITTTAGKWFSAFYALFAGLIFIAVAGILGAPVLHRVLHRLHLDEKV
jgi:hypothetical protein